MELLESAKRPVASISLKQVRMELKSMANMTARNRSVTTSCGRDVLLPFECRLYSGSGINGRFFTAEIKILKANATVPFLARISDHFGTAFCCFFVFAWCINFKVI
eukprot:s765_g27.t2